MRRYRISMAVSTKRYDVELMDWTDLANFGIGHDQSTSGVCSGFKSRLCLGWRSVCKGEVVQ